MKILAIKDFRVGSRILDPLRKFSWPPNWSEYHRNTKNKVVFNAEHISMMYFTVSQPTPNLIVKNGRVLKEKLIPQRQHALQYYSLSISYSRP